MATVTKYPLSNDAGFTNADNAHADDGVYATAAPAQNDQVIGFWYNFDFAIPAGSGIAGVTIEAQWKLSTTLSIHTFKLQAFLGDTPMGTELSITTEPTTDRTDTKSTLNGSWFVGWLNDNSLSGFRIRVRSVRGNSATAVTMSLDYVSATITYNAPPLAKTQTQDVTIEPTATGTAELFVPETEHLSDVVKALGTAELVDIYATGAIGTAELMSYVDITKAFLHDANVGFTDYTDEANEDTADDVALLPATIGANDAFYFLAGFYGAADPKVYGLYIDITTAGVGTYTLAWEYYNGASWVSLDDYIVTFGYSINYKTLGIRKIDISEPPDISDVIINSLEAKWIRARYVSGTVTIQPLARRIKVYEIAPYTPIVPSGQPHWKRLGGIPFTRDGNNQIGIRIW